MTFEKSVFKDITDDDRPKPTEIRSTFFNFCLNDITDVSKIVFKDITDLDLRKKS
jgi:hypothetical protein